MNDEEKDRAEQQTEMEAYSAGVRGVDFFEPGETEQAA